MVGGDNTEVSCYTLYWAVNSQCWYQISAGPGSTHQPSYHLHTMHKQNSVQLSVVLQSYHWQHVKYFYNNISNDWVNLKKILSNAIRNCKKHQYLVNKDHEAASSDKDCCSVALHTWMDVLLYHNDNVITGHFTWFSRWFGGIFWEEKQYSRTLASYITSHANSESLNNKQLYTTSTIQIVLCRVR